MAPGIPRLPGLVHAANKFNCTIKKCPLAVRQLRVVLSEATDEASSIINFGKSFTIKRIILFAGGLCLIYFIVHAAYGCYKAYRERLRQPPPIIFTGFREPSFRESDGASSSPPSYPGDRSPPMSPIIRVTTD